MSLWWRYVVFSLVLIAVIVAITVAQRNNAREANPHGELVNSVREVKSAGDLDLSCLTSPEPAVNFTALHFGYFGAANCSNGIYLDVGSNIGVQIRKLYNPELFPGASVLDIFDEYFGSVRTNTCAVGFEPNIAHTPYLTKLNKYFTKKSLPAMIYTGIAVAARDGWACFFDEAGSDHMQWGASLFDWHRHGHGSGAWVWVSGATG